MANSDVYCIVTAAGSSMRMGSTGDKLLQLHRGQPVVRWAVTAMLGIDPAGVVIVAPPERVELYAGLLADLNVKVVPGGASRSESVDRGLQSLPAGFSGYVLIHDGARPFASVALAEKVLAGSREYGACVPVVGSVDTVYRVSEDAAVEVLPREQIAAAQTPQGFALVLLQEAYRSYFESGRAATDEGSMVLSCGHRVHVVPGERGNIKLTTPEDLKTLKRERSWRMGTGYDSHQLIEGRHLILGGVHIPFSRGLLGHSDADVLVHAIMDALLGAVGLGDIGMHFPDSSDRYKGADSLHLLSEVRDMIVKAGGRIENVDATVVLEEPRVAPYKALMRQNIARALSIEIGQVSVKATTNEGMGHIGRGEGAACHAVASVSVEINALAPAPQQRI
ncbi:MAG TPA: 2-C-methyl-D-erythritol 2,4-cyclodiphosphate synthase [Bacillota bacterium]|nr:2-C-methyl-D-erythritol 2,4-cyclodiphosphate synthase [Bacillota bacterium]